MRFGITKQRTTGTADDSMGITGLASTVTTSMTDTTRHPVLKKLPAKTEYLLLKQPPPETMCFSVGYNSELGDVGCFVASRIEEDGTLLYGDRDVTKCGR